MTRATSSAVDRARRGRSTRRGSGSRLRPAPTARAGASGSPTSRATSRANRRDGPWPPAISASERPVGDEPVELARRSPRASRARARARCPRRSRGYPASSKLALVREHRVREPARLADLLEQPRRHAAAEHLVDDRQRVPVGVERGERAHAGDDVRLLGVAVAARRPAAAVAASSRGRAGRAPSVDGKRVVDRRRARRRG